MATCSELAAQLVVKQAERTVQQTVVTVAEATVVAEQAALNWIDQEIQDIMMAMINQDC